MTSLDVVIPVLNEEAGLPRCVETLSTFLANEMDRYEWRIVIADNGSTDATPHVAQRLTANRPDRVTWTRLSRRGRGLALRHAWLGSTADVLSYMDVDLSTGLDAFPALIDAIAVEGCDIAIGSRLAKGARIKRSLKREVVSRTYNFMIKAMFQTRFSDAQCGFKAISHEAAQVLVPKVENNHWFFDTELLIIAEKRGFKLREVGVTWDEDADTRVKIIATALEDLRGLARLRLGGLPKVERLRSVG